ncbi:MAG: SEC-C metal-binding domain-containing protein [Sedimenticola sp.]
MPSMTIRLTEDLKEQLAAFSKIIGVSQNALITMAIDEYLSNRQPRETRQRNEKEFESTVSDALYELSKNRPCPCGSGKKFKNCCGQR